MFTMCNVMAMNGVMKIDSNSRLSAHRRGKAPPGGSAPPRARLHPPPPGLWAAAGANVGSPLPTSGGPKGTTTPPQTGLFAPGRSAAADAAAKWLRVSPLAPNARALVLAVHELPPSPLDIPTVRDFQRALLDEARHTAGRAAATLRERFETIETRVVSGDPR